MIERPCIIILDSATSDEIEAVHEIVRVHSVDWWHQFTNVWIAGGRTAVYWRTLIKPVIPHGLSSVLVIEIPEVPVADIKYYGVKSGERQPWLWEKLRDEDFTPQE